MSLGPCAKWRLDCLDVCALKFRIISGDITQMNEMLREGGRVEVETHPLLGEL